MEKPLRNAGRPLKNANHPLARLREILSTPLVQVTRGDLARECGVPEATLKDIEAGKFKLSWAVAMKIAHRCGVHPKSLMDGADPLLDFDGKPFMPGAGERIEQIANSEIRLEARRHLYEAAMEAALDKGIGMLVQYSFEHWLKKTCESLDLKDVLAERITERLESFEPNCIPFYFQPRDRQLSAHWKEFEKQINDEQLRLFESGWGWHAPEPDATEGELVAETNHRFYRCRVEARYRVAEQRRKARKEAEESDRKRLQAKKPAGTRSRLAIR
jgi:DNA-binding XRE family transcriptional regulator